MSSSDLQFDWHSLAAETAPAGGPAAGRRLRLLLALVAAAAGVVLLRAVQLELTGGAEFRALAMRPIARSRPLPADRGRILARDGSVLAADAHTRALALDYRWLQWPADPAWLRRKAIAPLDRRQRRDAALVARRQEEILAQRADLHRRLAQLCGLSDDDWQARCAAVQAQVAALAAGVNERRLARYEAAQRAVAEEAAGEPAAGWGSTIAAALADLFAPEAPAPPVRVVVAEEQAQHPLVEDVTLEIAAEIAAHADDYPGVRIVELARRQYPAGTLAAQVIGHVEAAGSVGRPRSPLAPPPAGQMGIERRFEGLLCGTPGLEVERLDHRGKSLGVERQRAPQPGRDVTLTLDPALQATAESLLAAACRPRGAKSEPPAIGGAVVIMDVASGELLAAASAPRFDPQAFAVGDAEQLARLLAAPHDPLVDRVSRMAIPPGSVFKTLTAIALVESQACDPADPFDCQGYLHEPDRQRCQIFRQQGIGHGPVTLAAALAESCNVYFFHHASQLGPEPLVAWAARFGFGKPTGIDLPDEATGNLPAASSDDPRGQRLALAQSLAIGQGTLTVTPLQVARLMAAVANGGRMLRPRIVKSDQAGDHASEPASSRPIHLSPRTLAAVREGLRRTVADERGTAHDSARLAHVAIAGKTGTAQTAAADHAWFAGYAPADEPRIAIVVVLEHGGPAAGEAADCPRSGRAAPAVGLSGRGPRRPGRAVVICRTATRHGSHGFGASNGSTIAVQSL